MSLLKVIGLEKEFCIRNRTLKVLKGIDFSMEEGETVSIVGVSGVGKTTLLQIVGAIDRPTRGRILFRGEDITAMNECELDEFRNRHIGFVFQFHYLMPEFTALENVAMPALIAGVSRKEAFVRAGELLEYLGLGERLEHKPGELSGGEQQRVAIARALVNNPALVLADEPTGNLDTETQKLVFDLFLRAVREYRASLLVVTHNEALALKAGKTFKMENGLLYKMEHSAG